MASPLRAFAACEMQGVQAAHAAHDAHDAHAMHHAAPTHEHDVAPASTDAPESGRTPAPCLDLTHCAVLAWTPVAPRVPSVVVEVERRIIAPDASLRSVGRSIDTPPPKRG